MLAIVRLPGNAFSLTSCTLRRIHARGFIMQRRPKTQHSKHGMLQVAPSLLFTFHGKRLVQN